MLMQIFGPLGEFTVALKEEPTVVAQRLRWVNIYLDPVASSRAILTRGPCGPSLTAQTEVPQILQYAHLQVLRS